MGITLKNGFEVPIGAAIRKPGPAVVFTRKGFNRKLFIMPDTSFTVIKVDKFATGACQAVS
jgi:hypothetical protein